MPGGQDSHIRPALGSVSAAEARRRVDHACSAGSSRNSPRAWTTGAGDMETEPAASALSPGRRLEPGLGGPIKRDVALIDDLLGELLH